MAKLIFAPITSLDGYISDESGNFDWAEPDEEVHAFANDLMRPVGTHLYGRHMYETMRAWESMDIPDEPANRAYRDFAEMWRVAEKVVYSRTLQEPSTARTRIERNFDPDAVRRTKASATHDLAIAGPDLAAHAFKASLIDEVDLIIAPFILGGGTRALPADVRLELELVDERRFAGGFVFLRYRAKV